MSDNTPIEWADRTANFINGCTVTSPGCTNCYAMRSGRRNLPNYPSTGLTMATKAGHVWTGEVRRNEKVLKQVLGWRKPRRIFWNAHGDTFHENVPDEWIDQMFAVMALTPQHIHMVLTKRSARMREYFSQLPARDDYIIEAARGIGCTLMACRDAGTAARGGMENNEHIWLGVSVEDQTRADERIPDLLATPAAVRFLSCEPLLGPVDLGKTYASRDIHGTYINVAPILGLDWVIPGGESGPGARPMHPDWVRSLRDQCAAANVPFHFKQWGEWAPDFEDCPDRPDDSDTQSRFDTCVWDTELDHFDKTNGSWCDSDSWYFAPNYSDPEQPMTRIGKKRAGRLLDGVEHSEFPA